LIDAVTYYGVFAARKSPRSSLTFQVGLLNIQGVGKVRSIATFK
jgi:hypothetical protein